MATTLQIKYYNTYILKKINESWNSSTGSMDRTNAQYDWYVEESRIKGDFNGKFSGIAPRAYLATDNKYQETFGNSIIYSGIFNSRTDVNETNQFSIANDITSKNRNATKENLDRKIFWITVDSNCDITKHQVPYKQMGYVQLSLIHI